MAKFEPGHTRTKGQNGEKGIGRPKKDAELSEIQRVTKQIVDEKLSRFMFMGRDNLNAILANKNTPAMDVMIVSLIKKGMLGGDISILNFLFDRTIGKVKERIDVTGDSNLAPRIIVTLPSNGREAP